MLDNKDFDPEFDNDFSEKEIDYFDDIDNIDEENTREDKYKLSTSNKMY